MELSISNLIKIIIALVVIVAVVYGVYRAVTGSIGDTFGAFGNGNVDFVLSLIRG